MPAHARALRMEARQLVSRQLATIGDALTQAVKRRESDMRRRSCSVGVKTPPDSARGNGEGGSSIKTDDGSRSPPAGTPEGEVCEWPEIRAPTVTDGSSAGVVVNAVGDIVTGAFSQAGSAVTSSTAFDGALDPVSNAAYEDIAQRNLSDNLLRPPTPTPATFENSGPALLLQKLNPKATLAPAASGQVEYKGTSLDYTTVLSEHGLRASSSEDMILVTDFEGPKTLLAQLGQDMRSAPERTGQYDEVDPRKLREGVARGSTSSEPHAELTHEDSKRPLDKLQVSFWKNPVLNSSVARGRGNAIPSQVAVVPSLRGSNAAGTARVGSTNSSKAGGQDPNHVKVHESKDVQLSNVHAQASALDKELDPYAIALQLESAAYGWPTVVGWLKSLFGNGLDSLQSRQDWEAYVARKENEIKALVEQTKVEEHKHRAAANEAMLDHPSVADAAIMSYRIVVTNIPTDADEEDVADYFKELGLRDIYLVKEGHPTNRTRAAVLEFSSVQSAERASRVIGKIFGLNMFIRPAAEVFGRKTG